LIVAIATVKRLFTIFAGVNISKGILFFKIYTSLILSFKFNWNNLKDNNFVLFYEEKWQKPNKPGLYQARLLTKTNIPFEIF